MQTQSGTMEVAGITEQQKLGMHESSAHMQIEQVVARLTQSDSLLINQTQGSFQMAESFAKLTYSRDCKNLSPKHDNCSCVTS